MPIEETGSGPTVAEPSTANNDIFGDEPETAEAVETQDATTETAEAEEGVAEVAQPETQAETEEADDWLPTEQEKVFPPEVMARYAKRYGYNDEDLSDPRIQRLLKDKINSDIELRNRTTETVEEEVQDEEPTLPEPAVEPTAQEIQAYLQRLEQDAAPRLNAQLATHFGTKLGEALQGVYKLSADGKTASIDPKGAENFSRVAFQAITNVLQTYAMDPNFASMIVKQGMSQTYNGFDQHWQDSSRQRTWESLRSSKAEYKSLPVYGTPEFDQAIARVADIVPGMGEAVFVGKNGQPLSAEQNFQRKAEIAARILSGQKVSAPEISKAIETGKRVAQRAAVQAKSGQLGAGKSQGQLATAKGKTANDDIFGEGEDIFKQRHGRL